MTHFDYNATTPLRPVAREAWLRTVDEFWQNPSSPYRSAARARNELERLRQELANTFGCNSGRIVFTSGATEANNAVLRHFALESGSLAVSSVEHPSTLEPARFLFRERLCELPVTPDGILDFNALERIVKKALCPVLVSLMAANNETGVLQPWERAASFCRNHGVIFHTDAVQWLGKLPSGEFSKCDYVTGSAHKFGGPKGVGFLLTPHGDTSFKGQRGGGQENDHRGGTENLPAVAAMVAALQDAQAEAARVSTDNTDAQAFFEADICARIPGTQVMGAKADRLWNTTMLLMPRHKNTRWVAKLDRKGWELSTGSACASGKSGPSHVLAAMGIDPDRAWRAVRISAGHGTSKQDWKDLAIAMAEVWQELEAESGQSSVIDI